MVISLRVRSKSGDRARAGCRPTTPLIAVGIAPSVVQRTVLRQPFGGGLGADLVDAGHVVDGVADQHQVIDDALGRHAELLALTPSHVQRFGAHGVDQRDVVVDQLRHVLVAGGDDALHALRRGLHRQRADHVVGLDAFDPSGPASPWRCTACMDRLDLARQVFRHRLAGGLVLGDTDRREKSCPGASKMQAM